MKKTECCPNSDIGKIYRVKQEKLSPWLQTQVNDSDLDSGQFNGN